ncbi:immunoglobulin superfamily member 5 [Talpa occidentalis]|uniref:immunoglobulin superfamily member 5 n=1 Tax=Talpa occidentalis TaxID=50954 RepID=UPI00188FDAF2|nr:immunoglobulin superfamily member 5 [Talpa occidentalis]
MGPQPYTPNFREFPIPLPHTGRPPLLSIPTMVVHCKVDIQLSKPEARELQSWWRQEGHEQMEGRRTGIWAALAVLLGLAACGSGYQIVEGPRNATVLAGSQARFNCTVSQGWKLIMWALNGVVVLSVTPSGPINTSERFTSASYDEVGGNIISEMLIHDVQLSDTGHIRCSLQSSDRVGDAFLSVQVMGSLHIPNDSPVVKDEPCNVTCRASGWIPLPDISWEIGVPASNVSYFSIPDPDDLQSTVSVLMLMPQGDGMLTCVAHLKELPAHKAVTVNLTVVPPGSIQRQGASLPTWAIILIAVSLSLLLILLIVLIIVFCCCRGSRKEKKESNYDSEIRKSANPKTSETSETKSKDGNENYGYQAEELRPTTITYLPSKSPASGAPEQRDSRQPRQGPDDHQPPAHRPHVTFFMASPRRVRNVTLV